MGWYARELFHRPSFECRLMTPQKYKKFPARHFQPQDVKIESMIEILPIQAHQVADAKHVIYTVAWRIFRPEMTIDEFMAIVNESHELDDMDNVREIYTENRGLFLVVLDDGKVVGTGAIRKHTESIAELKRIWLLESYHG